MGGLATKGPMYKGADWASKQKSAEMVGNPFFEVLWGGDEYTKNQQFGQAHPDAPPPAKGQNNDSYVNEYLKSHPAGALKEGADPNTAGKDFFEKPQTINMTPQTPLADPNTPTASQQFSTPQRLQYSTGSTPNIRNPNTNVPNAPKLGSVETKAAPQVQNPNAVQAARAVNRMAGENQQTQFTVPNLGNIQFGGS